MRCRQPIVCGGILLLTAALAACTAGDAEAPAAIAARLVTPQPDTVCHACFWAAQPPSVRAELVDVYRWRPASDPLVAAEMRLITARLSDDRGALCDLPRAYAGVAARERGRERRLLALESAAFLTAECGLPSAVAFTAAAAAARDAGQRWKAEVYASLAADTFRARFAPAHAERRLVVPAGTEAYVIGRSAIRVRARDRIVTQMERVARDWLSYQLAYDFAPSLSVGAMLDYQEGARLHEVAAATGARVQPTTGVLAVQVAGRWWAADEHGVFRFEVLPDKLQYPTTRAWHGIALLVDTHGISNLVEAALRTQADLVVGCGDFSGKMDAAAYLAERGVDVYFPTDRFVAEVLGYTGGGVLIGSAPVRRERRGVVIGDRPVTFRVTETIVVEATQLRGSLQYYDAADRYFAKLAEVLPLRIERVAVDGEGQSGRVIARARQLGAAAVALRVWTEADYVPVRAWLAESTSHRAVLFHSAPYPFGARLFEEFPRQATFGDPRPAFLTRSTS